MSKIKAGWALLLPAALLWWMGARAGDLGGSARIYTAATDTGDGTENALSQDYSFRYRQPLTPRLGLFLSAQASRFDVDPEDGSRFERSSEEPFVEVAYGQETFSARLGYRERESDGTSDADVLDTRSAFAHFSWRPARGPKVSLRLTDGSNVADVAVFGQDVDTTSVDLETSYFAKRWSARYSFSGFYLENNVEDLSLDQERHTLRGTYEDHYLGGRLSLATDWLVSRTEQVEESPAGTAIADPVAAREGLFAVDLSPGIGSLDPVPSLVDGDRATPAGLPSGIQIGGASTFRNVGVDLGFGLPVTRLEVSVNTDSDASLNWEVYESSDNLNWVRVAGGTATFESAPLFRYTIRFPETENRFFKVVNVSVNSRPDVLVTEIRALVDRGVESRTATTRRATILARMRPGDRVTGSFSIGYDDEGGSGGGLPDLDTRDVTFDSLVGVDLTGALALTVQAHVSHFDRDLEPAVSREERRFALSFLWDPLPTVDALFSVSRREERDQSSLVRLSDVIRARAVTDLLPGLQLTSEVSYDCVEDPFSGFELSSVSWSEHFDTRLTSRVTLNGGFTVQRFDTRGTVSISERLDTFWRATWSPFSSLHLVGDWSFGEEDERETSSQRYSVAWAPGPRLSLSGSYTEIDSAGEVTTRTTGSSLNYRLNRLVNLFSTFSRSELRQDPAESSRVTSLVFGTNLAF